MGKFFISLRALQPFRHLLKGFSGGSPKSLLRKLSSVENYPLFAAIGLLLICHAFSISVYHQAEEEGIEIHKAGLAGLGAVTKNSPSLVVAQSITPNFQLGKDLPRKAVAIEKQDDSSSVFESKKLQGRRFDRMADALSNDGVAIR